MRKAGVILILVAVVVLVLAFGMDTSIETRAGGRVHNVGLMQEQQLFALLGIALFVGGVILLGIGLARRPRTSGVSSDEVVCPFCAETIKRGAIVCHSAITHCHGRFLPRPNKQLRIAHLAELLSVSITGSAGCARLPS